jgi:hypothetical protein
MSNFEEKYMIVGETIDTKQKVKKETEEFFQFILNDKTGKNPNKLLIDFAAVKGWSFNEFNQPHASDLRAVWTYYELWLNSSFTKPKLLKTFWTSPEDQREKIFLAYNKARSGGTPVSDEQINRANLGIKYLIEAHDNAEKATNERERIEAGQRIVYVIKEVQRALGLRPCGAEDCTKYIIGRRKTAKYHSDKCKNRQASKRKRRNNPQAYLRAQKKYLQFLEDEGDLG